MLRCVLAALPRGGAVCGKVVAEVWWIGGWDGLEETIRKLDLGPVEKNMGMDQYLLIPILGFTRYQGFDPSPYLLFGVLEM